MNTVYLVYQTTTPPVTDIHTLHVEWQILRTERRCSHGQPTITVIANIYMEHFETLAIESAKFKPATWLRYVDDTFVVYNEGQDKLHSFLEHLNSVRSSIKFTMEVEEDRKLPFLDAMVMRNEDRLVTSVYRKKTHTDR